MIWGQRDERGMRATEVYALAIGEGPKGDMETAPSGLRQSLRAEPHQPRSRLLRDSNAWLTCRDDAGIPVPNSELNQLVGQIDGLLAAADVPRPYAVRVGQRLHFSSGMRFH